MNDIRISNVKSIKCQITFKEYTVDSKLSTIPDYKPVKSDIHPPLARQLTRDKISQVKFYIKKTKNDNIHKSEAHEFR